MNSANINIFSNIFFLLWQDAILLNLFYHFTLSLFDRKHYFWVYENMKSKKLLSMKFPSDSWQKDSVKEWLNDGQVDRDHRVLFRRFADARRHRHLHSWLDCLQYSRLVNLLICLLLKLVKNRFIFCRQPSDRHPRVLPHRARMEREVPGQPATARRLDRGSHSDDLRLPRHRRHHRVHDLLPLEEGRRRLRQMDRTWSRWVQISSPQSRKNLAIERLHL